MSKRILDGQISIFDIIVDVPVETKPSVVSIPKTLSDFDKQYGGYVPSSFDELCTIVDSLGELIKKSYAEKGIELINFGLYHHLFPGVKCDDLYDYRINWDIQKPGTTGEVNRVSCYIGRLSPTCADCWREGDVFTYTPSVHTVKRAGDGKLSADKSIFCKRLDEIIGVSLKLLEDLGKPQKVSKSKSKMSPIQQFIKDNDGIVIDDSSNEASVNAKKSDSFMNFCRGLKSALNKEAKAMGFDVVTLKTNHYDMSGFFNKGDKYVYWSFSVQRYGSPTYLNRRGAVDGFLYRTAENEKDFKGGPNHFTDLAHLCSEAYSLI